MVGYTPGVVASEITLPNSPLYASHSVPPAAEADTATVCTASVPATGAGEEEVKAPPAPSSRCTS